MPQLIERLRKDVDRSPDKSSSKLIHILSFDKSFSSKSLGGNLEKLLLSRVNDLNPVSFLPSLVPTQQAPADNSNRKKRMRFLRAAKKLHLPSK